MCQPLIGGLFLCFNYTTKIGVCQYIKVTPFGVAFSLFFFIIYGAKNVNLCYNRLDMM